MDTRQEFRVALVVPAIALLLLAGSGPTLFASSPPNVSDNCESQVNQQSAALAAGLNNTKAIGLAIGSSAFQVRAGSNSYQFNSIFNVWQFNTACQVTNWKSVNVVFSVGQNMLIVTENPSLTNVLNVTVQPAAIENTSPWNSNYWAGYDFYEHNPSGGLYPIYESVGDWNAPIVSQPPQGQGPSCKNPQCALSVWVGLAPQPFNITYYFVQAGTTSNITCNPSCGSQYWGWYEFNPAAAVKCLDVAPGDSISTQVYNQAGGGGSVASYNVFIDDNTLYTSCTVSNYLYSHGYPYYAQFMSERPLVNGVFAHLPQFTSPTTMKGFIYSNNNIPTIYDPYHRNYYQEVFMVNSGYNNINVGSVSSSGTFTLSWHTSLGT